MYNIILLYLLASTGSKTMRSSDNQENKDFAIWTYIVVVGGAGFAFDIQLR